MPIQDVRYALRGMAKRPAASALLVATLAVGLAANAVIFNVLDKLVLRPFDFPNVPRLVRLWETEPRFDGIERSNVAPANLLDWRAQGAAVFEALIGLDWWNANLSGREIAQRVQGYRVSPGFFAALGVAPVLGRGFLEDEAAPGRGRVVVLGHDLWRRRYGGDPSLVGQSIRVDAEPHLVVGIAPPGFRFPDGSEVWAPLELPPPAEAPRDRHYLGVLGLLAAGRSVADARAGLSVVARRLQADHPQLNKERGIEVSAFATGFADPFLPSLLAIWQAGALLVLLIACVNVANLILARGAERRRELALRLALGAGQGRVVRQLLTEGLVAALLAVALALPLTLLAARALRDPMPAEIARFLPGWQLLGGDLRTLAFTAGLSVLATGFFSALPALRASRPDLVESLREGGRGRTAGRARQRGRSTLVVAQVAAALVLLATAGFAVRSADALLNGPQGFDPDRLLGFTVSLSEGRYAEPARRLAFARAAEARLRELAGVEGVAFTTALPGAGGGYTTRPIEVEGAPLAPGQEPPRVDARWVSAGYFDTLMLPIFAGRGIAESDDERAPQVAVVSRTMAERHWPGRDPIGRRFRVAGGEAPWVTVVGVSGDVIHQWVTRRNTPTFYRPFAQEPRLDLAFALRTAGEPEPLAASARQAIAAVDADQPASNLLGMRRAISRSTIGLQYVAAIMAAFGALALVLAVSGIYGVMAYRVSLRTQEIGVRRALGATNLDVLRLTLGQALRLSGLGLAVGALLAVGAGRVLSSTLLGAVDFDPASLAVLAGVLAAAALLAAWVPARRALAVDPALALRSE